MNSQRIKEIQMTTAYPDSISVQQALLQTWNECEQESRAKLSSLHDKIYGLEAQLERALMVPQEIMAKHDLIQKEWDRHCDPSVAANDFSELLKEAICRIKLEDQQRIEKDKSK